MNTEQARAALTAQDEALLRQALEALEAAASDDQPYIVRTKAAIAALRERLGVKEQA